MTFKSVVAFIACLFVASFALADDKPSPVAKKIIDEAVREVRRNRQAFDKANDAPLAKAKSELQEWSSKLIKDGKADEATAVLAQLKTLEADVMKMANAPVPASGPGNAGPKVVSPSPAVGKWTWPYEGAGVNPWFELHPDGLTVASWHGEKGLWTRGEDGLIRVWATKSRIIAVFEISKDGNALRDPSGKISQRIR